MATYTKLLNGLETIGMHQMHAHLDTYIDLVSKGEKTFTDALLDLVNLEIKCKESRAVNACVKTANFPFLKTLDDFDFDFQPSVNKSEVQELTSLKFVEKNENIIFVGSSGVGKTHLATSVGIECAKQRYSTYFISFESLMNQLKKAYQENRLDLRMKFFAGKKVLIIDELGYMPLDPDAASLFFQLVARRYEKHSTIITTNLAFSKWGELFGSATLANAILDRLLHHSQIFSITGPSYRLKEKRTFLESQSED